MNEEFFNVKENVEPTWNPFLAISSTSSNNGEPALFFHWNF